MDDLWLWFARCRDLDPELFFPASEVGPGAAQVLEAKAECALCPVQEDCLARFMGEEFGVFGGMSADERKAARRKARAA